MAKLSVFILLFFGHVVLGQDKYPTKSQVIKSLTQKTRLKNKIYESTNWFSIIDSSTYRSTDTLVFYNNSNNKLGRFICNIVDWNFYKKDALWVQHEQLCKEPATATAIKDDDFFTYDVSDGLPLTLRISNKDGLVDEFEVLSLTKSPLNNRDQETTDVLTLLRIKLVKNQL